MITAQAQRIASLEYFKIAQKVEEQMEKELDPERKTALRMIAGQNYFYAGIEAIESILREAGISVESHLD